MLLQALQAVAPAVRFMARFAILLLVFYVLRDAVRSIGVCFDADRSIEPLLRPFCIVFVYVFRTDLLAEIGVSSLLWHYLPSIVLAFAGAWTLVDRRRIALRRMHPAMRFAALLLGLTVLYELAYQASTCFSPRWTIPLETVPICVRTHYAALTERWGETSLLDLLSHLLSPIAAAVLVTVVWARRDRRHART